MGLHEKVLGLIQRETDKARKGEPARIVAKMNSLVDPSVIRALYGASQAGVRIELLVRGVCCLRPGMPEVSENIRVTSVVDRFLEHSRVFAFGEGPQAEVWMSSADWMPRNFVRRIETMFPVEDPAIRQRLLDEVLGIALKDNVKARRLQREGTYVPVGQDGAQVRSQMVLLEIARRMADPKPIESLLRHVAAPEMPAETLRSPTTPVPPAS
jgi:polyphosphate kinase